MKAQHDTSSTGKEKKETTTAQNNEITEGVGITERQAYRTGQSGVRRNPPQGAGRFYRILGLRKALIN
jgi:hypothetical protein